MPFSKIYDDIPIGVCAIKRDRKNLTVLYANPIFLKSLGYMHAQEILGMDLEDAWPEDETFALAKKLKSPTPPQNATLSIRRPRIDKKLWALVSIEEKQFDDKDCFILWATDISASKEIESQLSEALETSDAKGEQKSNFLATMSHEIRTPMQSVYGLLELIEQDNPEPNTLNMVQTAKNSASGLLEILDDILDFAKMDADQMELDLFEVPIRTLARGINEALAVKIQGKLVELCDNIAEDVPFVVVGDPKRLRQVIMNLMSNAMKFTHEGNVTLKITRKTAQKEAEENKRLRLRFEIIDTGIGMSVEAASKLFTPFTQADNSTSRKYGGTGLGLSISKKLVEMMGGSIGVISQEGKGSTFWFEIPTEAVDAETNLLEMPNLDGISVLSVEDHPQGSKEIKRSLESMGAIVESCNTYAEAIELTKRRPFDVALIDQGLPDGLGLDLIREIMELRPFTGIIMYTVREDAGLQHTIQSLGASYITKPASRIGLGEGILDAASKVTTMNITGSMKMIIAEDTESVRDVLKRQLDLLGVEAKFVENGVEAIKAVETREYGILLTDLHMPEMDGYEVIKIIREQDKELGRHFPVISLTADVQMSERQIYMKHGFDECLLKPVSLGQFRRLLIRWGILDGNASQDKTLPKEKVRNNIDSAIDKNAIIQQMGALDENTIQMLGMFIEMTEPVIDKIHSAKTDENFHDLSELGHSLKGAARSACANALGNHASKLQDTAAENKNCNKIIEDISNEFERVKKEIKQLKAE